MLSSKIAIYNNYIRADWNRQATCFGWVRGDKHHITLNRTRTSWRMAIRVERCAKCTHVTPEQRGTGCCLFISHPLPFLADLVVDIPSRVPPPRPYPVAEQNSHYHSAILCIYVAMSGAIQITRTFVKGALAAFLVGGETICHHKLPRRDAMLHLCNKTIANRYKKAYWGPAVDFWRYSFEVWWQGFRLASSALPIRQKCRSQLGNLQKKATSQRVTALRGKHSRWSGFFT